MAVVAIQIRTLDNEDKVVETIDVKGKSEAQVERVMMGLMRQMDTDEYYAIELEEGL